MLRASIVKHSPCNARSLPTEPPYYSPQLTPLPVAGDPYQESLHPNYETDPTVREAAVARTQKDWGTDPSAHWLLAQDVQKTTYGFALWNIYSEPRPESQWKQPIEVDWCTGRRAEIAHTFLSMNASMRERFWGGKPYVLLNLLCVHQDFQRKGAGKMLVQWGIGKAEELGLCVHLEASPAGVFLYKTMGFRQIDLGIVRKEEWDGDRDLEFVVMVRNPTHGEAFETARRQE